MARQARRLIAAALGAILVAAGSPTAGPVQMLAGRYHDGTSHAEIIPVDARHAYVHLFFLFGLLNDKMCEFEEVATTSGDALIYEHASAGADDPPCSLRLRRERGMLTWLAADLSCTQYCPNRSLADGDFPWSSRRRVSKRSVLAGEGLQGYDATVAAWRADQQAQYATF